jgi:hypothetical protein
MSATRLLVGAVAVLAVAAAGGLLASPPGAGDGAGLVVHEWGTFSSLSGSDGALLKFHPANTDLPKFVYRNLGDLFRKDAYLGTVSLETPVLYFYSDRPRTASARAEFPSGVFTEWFPHADRSKANVLSWSNVRIRPDGPVRLPVTSDEYHYYAAREADATPVEVVFSQDGKERRDQEGFLFYRGVGDLKPPLVVTAQGGGAFTLRVTGTDLVASALLLDVRAGAVRYRQIDPIPAGASVTANLPGDWSNAGPVRAALVSMLIRAGLYEKEARAMVKTWESAWLRDEGTRVLSVLPAGWTDRALPLRVTPKPDSLVRVLVGRHDILTPEREREIDGLVRQLHGPSAAERSAADGALAKLGRFAAPARQRAEERVAGRR